MLRLLLMVSLVIAASGCETQDDASGQAMSGQTDGEMERHTALPDATEGELLDPSAGASSTAPSARPGEATAPAITDAAPSATDAGPDQAVRGPLRLRPNVLPDGYVFENAFENRIQGVSGHEAVYGLPDAGIGPSPRITVSVSTGAEIGGFEGFGLLHATGMSSDLAVDVNGVQAISSTLAPLLVWVGEGDTRVSMYAGADVTSDELLSAARGLEQTTDGPRIRDGALPEGAVLLDETGSQDFVNYLTTMRMSIPAGQDGVRYLNVLVVDQTASDTSADDTPTDSNTATSRWDRASVQRWQDSFSVEWSERENVTVSVGVADLPEAELEAFVNGLERVSEDDWQTFLELAFPRGTPTPEAGTYIAQSISVPAAPDDTVRSWLERVRHLGLFLCETASPGDPYLGEFVATLPEFQEDSGFADIEALAEDQRTFACEP